LTKRDLNIRKRPENGHDDLIACRPVAGIHIKKKNLSYPLMNYE